MKYVNFSVIFIGYAFYAFAGRTSLDEDLTVLIDYTKYRDYYAYRVGRQSPNDNSDGIFPPLQQSDHPPNHGPPHKEPDHGPPPPNVCHDPHNEVYQQCGSKCVLGCRFAVASSSGVSISKNECNKNDCVEGCFCKTGLVRHQTKCIPALECPIRKCNHREEVYMCGPAAPITCDNATRGKEIAHLTKHVECVWGCFCAQGYLRNNYNGKCVPEPECRSNKIVDISPQIPGLFKHLGHGSPGPVIYHAGAQGPGHGYGSSYGSNYGNYGNGGYSNSGYGNGGGNHGQGGSGYGGNHGQGGGGYGGNNGQGNYGHGGYGPGNQAGSNGYGNSGPHTNNVNTGGNVDNHSGVTVANFNALSNANNALGIAGIGGIGGISGIGGIGGIGGFGGGGGIGGGGGFGGGFGGGHGLGFGGGGHFPGGYGGYPGYGGGGNHHHYYGNGTGTGTGGGGSCNGENNCNGVNNGVGNTNNGTINLTGGFGNLTRLAEDTIPEDKVDLDDEPEKSDTTESSKPMATDANAKPAVNNAATVATLPQSQPFQNFPAFYPIFSAQIAPIANAYVPQQQQQQPQPQTPSTTKSAKPETTIKEPIDDVEPGKDENKINLSSTAATDVQQENIVVSTTPSTIPTNGIVSNFVLSPTAQFSGNSFVQVPSSYLPNIGVQNNGAGFVSNLVLSPALSADSQSNRKTENAPPKAIPNSSAVRKPQRDSAVTTANKPSTEKIPSATVQPIFSGGSCNGKNNCNKKN